MNFLFILIFLITIILMFVNNFDTDLSELEPSKGPQFKQVVLIPEGSRVNVGLAKGKQLMRLP